MNMIEWFNSLKNTTAANNWRDAVTRHLSAVSGKRTHGRKLRTIKKQIGKLNVAVSSPADLLAPKLKRNEPRDRAHAEWARRLGLLAA